MSSQKHSPSPLATLGLAVIIGASLAVPTTAETPIIEDMGECIGANSNVALEQPVTLSVELPDDPKSGWVDESLYGRLGLFFFHDEIGDLYWYEFTGKTAVWEECDGLTPQVSTGVHVEYSRPA